MRSGLFFCVLGLSWGGIGGCLSPPDADDGVLRVAIDREPLTWNRLLADELMTHIVTEQLHAPLIRLNPETQEMEPALAESWTFNDDGDGSVLEFRLREGVRFSDGAPFSAADVSFTFDVLADPRAGSPLTDSARIDGEVLSPEVVDPLTVRFHLPRRTATVERVFDGIRILPKHKLAESSSAGTVAADTALGVASEDVVGLGPFRLKEHVSGQRIELERNPHYYRASQGYPRLQAIVFHVVSDPNAQRLRLQAGEIDVLARTTSDTFVALRRELDASIDAEPDIVIEDLGPSLLSERLWFNLNPESPIESRKKEWFADIRFRRAVSLAIDRTEMARIVFESLASPAEGAVSVGNTFWQDRELMPLEHDIARARALLGEAGFTLREDALFDSHGNRVRFSVSTTA